MGRPTRAQRAEQIRRQQAAQSNPSLWPNDGCACNHSRSFHSGGGPGSPCRALGCTCAGVSERRSSERLAIVVVLLAEESLALSLIDALVSRAGRIP